MKDLFIIGFGVGVIFAYSGLITFIAGFITGVYITSTFKINLLFQTLIRN